MKTATVPVILGSVLVALTALPAGARADGPINLPEFRMPTMGGKQFWADEFFFHQWRIQRNVLTGHCRLLDEGDFRHESGTFRECRSRLEGIRREQNLPPMQGKAVIVVHGLFRSRSSMEKLCRHLRQQGGYTVFNVGYPSTQRDVGSHARALDQIIENLSGIEEINFVAHSMGNIVVRHYLADHTRDSSPSGSPPSTIVRRPDPRIRRFVMLGPPNHGSLAAVALSENAVFKILAGEAGQELGAEWAKLEDRLATPACEFGIVAGGREDRWGYNPLVPGDDDGTVSVASTRLAGARDFVVVPVLHSFLVTDKRALEYTLRFLREGHFSATGERRPVPVQ